MSIEYVSTLACNLKCEYCYQDPMRDALNIGVKRNWEAAKKTLLAENYRFSVFGGEALLTPIEELEQIFKFGYENFKDKVKKYESPNAIQTNGILITDAHIELFKKYKVGVGVSIDGPDSLNDGRIAGTLEETREATATTLRNIRKLLAAKVSVSIITTLTRHNTSPEAVKKLCSWFKDLDDKGAGGINIHLLEIERGRENQAVHEEQLVDALTHIYEATKGFRMNFKPFIDIRRLLLGEELDKVSCIWNACDPLTTDAVHGVLADGTLVNCGRTNKDGVNWVKSDKPGLERYLILHATSQEDGGCRDCSYFVFCKGQCPGTAIDGDWRNRTSHCSVWYRLFELIEADILRERRLPLSRDVTKLKEMESVFISKCRARVTGQQTKNHGDIAHEDIPHGDGHGDEPHQDHHGDSNLTAEAKGVDVTWV